MALPRPLYASLLAALDLPVLACAHLRLLAERHPGVPGDTIAAIFAQENQHRVLKMHHIHKAAMASYTCRYLSGVDVLDLCGDVDFPPCLMIRRMLETLMQLSKQRVGDILKEPGLLLELESRQAVLEQWLAAAQSHQPADGGEAPSTGQLAAAVPALLARLQEDVVRCTLADRSYSPACDMAKSLAGLEHEALLYGQLSAAGIPYWTEQQLREKGLFKTPDVLLQVPICVRAPSGCWHVVHWIDSKASFGDDRTHSQQMEGQYSTYLNRYGPGLVIYWFGFIADLNDAAQPADVLCAAAFPADEDLMQLSRLQAELGPQRMQS